MVEEFLTTKYTEYTKMVLTQRSSLSAVALAKAEEAKAAEKVVGRDGSIAPHAEIKRVKLGEVVSEYSVRNRDRSETSVFSVTNSNGFVSSTDYFSKEVFSKDLTTYKLVEKGMFAYNPSRINVGSVACWRGEGVAVVSPLYVVFKLDESVVDSRLLERFLHSSVALRQIKGLTSGSVRDSLKFSALCKIEIPLPPLSEQRRIAAVLDKISEMKRNVEARLKKLDLLVKARFNEMFGDPVTNPKGWEVRQFDSFSENLDGKRVPIASTERMSGDIPYYGASGIVDYVKDYIFDEEILLISEDGANLKIRSTPIAFSVSGKCWVNNHAHVIRFSDIATQKYVEFYIESINVESLLTGSTQPKLNQAKLNTMKLPLPPLPLQRQFAAFVEKVDALKAAAKAELEKVDLLYRAKLQEYFG